MESPVAALEDRELRDIMRTEIRRLPEREKLVLSLYYDEGLTLGRDRPGAERHREPRVADPHQVGAAPPVAPGRRRRRLTRTHCRRGDPGSSADRVARGSSTSVAGACACDRCCASCCSCVATAGGVDGRRLAPCWRPPVAAPVVDPFRQPACRWCPGNRGIEYATSPGDRGHSGGRRGGHVQRHASPVTRTSWSGTPTACGRRTATCPIGCSRRATSSPAGAIVGHAAGRVPLRTARRRCATSIPAPFIGRLAGVVRLVPADGSAPAPAPSAAARACSAPARSESR